MNREFLNTIVSSGIANEVIAALKVIAANRAAATPDVLRPFTGYVDPAIMPSDTVRNTAILAMLAHYTLNTIDTKDQ